MSGFVYKDDKGAESVSWVQVRLCLILLVFFSSFFNSYEKVVLELRNNIYPPLFVEGKNNKNYLHNVLLDEARKEFRKEKYAQIAENLAPTELDKTDP